MPLETKCAKFIENLKNQIGALIISNALDEMTTIIDSLNCITQTIVLILKRDDKVFYDFIFYKLLQSGQYFKEKIHNWPDSSSMTNDILHMLLKIFRIKFSMSTVAFEKI